MHELGFLERYLAVLDVEFSEINISIKQPHDPDSDGLCDYGEYLIGQGFLAVQICINSAWPLSDVNKVDALLNTPPYIKGDISFISVANAAANYFKHEGEWWDKNISNHSIKGAEKTIGRIESIVFERDYPLVNLLSALLDDPDDLNELQLSKFLPSINEWHHNLRPKV
jgi:hypothetical protein